MIALIRRRWLLLAVTSLAFLGAFLLWKAGEPYQDRYWSPDQRFYVQKFVNAGLSCIPVGPGQGSDSAGGYVRLFDRDGHRLAERFVRFHRDVKPVWSARSVYLLGVPEMDNAPWPLPEGER